MTAEEIQIIVSDRYSLGANDMAAMEDRAK